MAQELGEFSVLLVGDPALPRLLALRSATDAPLEKSPSARRMRGRVVHLIGDSKSLFSGVLRSGLAIGVVASPVGAWPAGFGRLDQLFHTAPLPWWTRRIHRFVVESQDQARSLHRSGVAMGRIVVVPLGEEEEVRGVYAEVWRMRG